MTRVRTRFAPSPTGFLHAGNVRTALFNLLHARTNGGDFILRVEDTDLKRSRREYEKALLEDLLWLGLAWDEGLGAGGEKGPYRQSERFPIYREFASGLLDKGLAYRCYCSKERLEELKKAQAAKGEPPRYDGRCRDLKTHNDGPFTIRFRVPRGAVRFTDLVHGEVRFTTEAFGDFVVMGSDGMASYNFAVVVDDALMGITDIIRGDDHLPNTPRQLILFDSLGFAAPRYAHIPLVLGADGSPLSKRDESLSLRALKREGYLPSAVINTVARLGWAPGEDFLDLKGLASSFSVERLSRSPARFDAERLKFFNKKAIERLTPEGLLRLAGGRVSGAEAARLWPLIDELKANAATLRELNELLTPFISKPEMDGAAKASLEEPGALDVIRAFREALQTLPAIDEAGYKKAAAAAAEKTGKKGRALFMPIRAALTGRTEGIELVKVIRLLGGGESIERLKKAEERPG